MDFLDSKGFEIANLIRVMGWKFIYTAEALIFMKLVRKFYKNISFEEHTVSSLVKREKKYLDDKILGEILKLPTIGELQNSRRDRSTRIETVIGIEDNSQFQRIHGRYLNIKIRLLYIIIC